jgi:hypothetical protein
VTSRVRVAASACLVASGLLIGGTGGAIALADPAHHHEKSDDRKAGDQKGDSDSRQRPNTRAGNDRSVNEATDTSDEGSTETKPTETKPTETKPTETKPTQTTPCPEPSPGQGPPPLPQTGGGGGGGGGGFAQIPRFKQPSVPDMQLPGELQPAQPGVPGVLDAAAGVAAGVPAGPAAPIALPVIVAPPIGLGGGGGGPRAAGAPPAPPSAGLKELIAEPPAGRIAPPNAGGLTSGPASSYRIGYTEYLRSAGLPQVAALAVPGLAGLLVLTGAGGMVGYRQARAGHTVRAGTARFFR